MNVLHLKHPVLIDHYSRRRVHVELTEFGHDIGVYKTVNLMEKLNIRAI